MTEHAEYRVKMANMVATRILTLEWDVLDGTDIAPVTNGTRPYGR